MRAAEHSCGLLVREKATIVPTTQGVPGPDVYETPTLGYLAGRVAFKSWASGEMLVPADALPALALEGVPFLVEGPAT